MAKHETLIELGMTAAYLKGCCDGIEKQRPKIAELEKQLAATQESEKQLLAKVAELQDSNCIKEILNSEVKNG